MPDRAQLERMIDLYLAALVAGDPGRLPLADEAVLIENNQRIAWGEGLWGTIDAIGTYRHYFADPEAGRAGFIGTAREGGVPGIFDLLVEVRDGRIVLAESYLIRDPVGAKRFDTMGAPEDVWLAAVPAAERLSRDQLIATANRYFAGMQRNDGKGDYSFFDPDCNRVEHGMQTTNVKTDQTYGHSSDTDFVKMTAENQWKTGFLGFVTEIRDRRFVAIDEERQVVLASAMFDHDGSVRSIELTTGKQFVLSPYFDVPRTLWIFEAFKLRQGKLFRVEATMGEIPYGQRPPLAAAA